MENVQITSPEADRRIARALRLFLWSLAGLVSPFVIVSLFLLVSPSDTDYRIGIGLGEIGGVVCFLRLPCALWIRLLCIAVYVPASMWTLYIYSFFFIFGVMGSGHC